jgi:hypothetical protein
MIDSAMTPEPTVATVRFESGDMRPSIGPDKGSREGRFRAVWASRASHGRNADERQDEPAA